MGGFEEERQDAERGRERGQQHQPLPHHHRHHHTQHQHVNGRSTVFLESNDGRLYPLHEYVGSGGYSEAVRNAVTVNLYKEKARMDWGGKYTLKVEVGVGGWGGWVAVALGCLAVGSMVGKGWEEICMDGDKGTITYMVGR